MGYLLFPPAPPVQREGQIDGETERDGGGSSGQSPLTKSGHNTETVDGWPVTRLRILP